MDPTADSITTTLFKSPLIIEMHVSNAVGVGINQVIGYTPCVTGTIGHDLLRIIHYVVVGR